MFVIVKKWFSVCPKSFEMYLGCWKCNLRKARKYLPNLRGKETNLVIDGLCFDRLKDSNFAK